MSPAPPPLSRAARTLREEFDRSFTLAPTLPPAGSENLLTIRVGAEPYAIRMAEIRGLYADRRILALPSAWPELLGVTGIRGRIVPVYQLAALLGREGAAAPRWMVLVEAGAPLAFGFDAFDAHISAGAGQLLAPDSAAEPAAGAVRTATGVLPLLTLGRLAERLARRVALAGAGG